jgi:hypothetical protein
VKSLSHANVWGVRKAPEGFQRWAIDSGHALEAQWGTDWKLVERAYRGVRRNGGEYARVCGGESAPR